LKVKPVLGLSSWNQSSNLILKISPIDGSQVCSFYEPDKDCIEELIKVAKKAQQIWSSVPMPKRAPLLVKLAEELEKRKSNLAELIQIEIGKTKTEAEGEIQEAIDMLHFCIGLTRSLSGTIFPSERENHFIFESWQPLGVVGIITAFNFPVAVWAWNAFLAVTCGNSTIWKPSELAPMTSFTACSLAHEIASSFGYHGLFNMICGGKEIGRTLAANPNVALVSATGSTEMGREVSSLVAQRLGKVILELGGNNAVIVHKDCDLENATRFCCFGIVGTSGQRCTSIRRLIIHRDIYDSFITGLISKLQSCKIGDPRLPDTVVGPLISEASVQKFLEAVKEGLDQGARLLYGGKVLEGFQTNQYVTPTLLEVDKVIDTVLRETFAPLAWCFKFSDLEEAIALNNSVPQGLSSACFTRSLDVAFKFLQGSDCGLANINTSTSGAEIGLAFGGEKATGGGREAGSDCWKYYMRRQSCVINWGNQFNLAQNVQIRF